jgi:PleD family two-component response regulator
MPAEGGSHLRVDESAITQIRPAMLSISPRVMLVDDDEIAVERMRMLVEAEGYEVSTAASAEAALALLQREFAPIVILDRNMPGMDGLELCRAIRDGTHYPGYVYIMLCTAHDTEEEILAGLDAGADDYLSKRASGAQLIARLACARRIISLEQSLKAVIEERRRMAMTDVLTGVHNRRYFMNHMRRELKRTRRFGGDLTLVVFDIDNPAMEQWRDVVPQSDDVIDQVYDIDGRFVVQFLRNAQNGIRVYERNGQLVRELLKRR